MDSDRRVSLAGLAAVVALAALAFGALRTPSEWGHARVFTVTVFLYLFATLRALLLPRRSRAPWVGFALFGWTYFVLCSLFYKAQFLGTTGLIEAIALRAFPPSPLPLVPGRTRVIYDPTVNTARVDFLATCQLVFGWLFAILGAVLALFSTRPWIAQKPRRRPASDSTVV